MKHLSLTLTHLFVFLFMVVCFLPTKAAHPLRISKELLPMVEPRNSSILRPKGSSAAANTPLLSVTREAATDLSSCYRQACRSIRNKDLESAESFLSDALQQVPGRRDAISSELHTAWAEMLILNASTETDLSQVAKRLEKAIRHDKNNHRARFYLGRLNDDLKMMYVRSENVKQAAKHSGLAEQHLKKARELLKKDTSHPDYSDVTSALFVARIRAGDVQKIQKMPINDFQNQPLSTQLAYTALLVQHHKSSPEQVRVAMAKAAEVIGNRRVLDDAEQREVAHNVYRLMEAGIPRAEMPLSLSRHADSFRVKSSPKLSFEEFFGPQALN